MAPKLIAPLKSSSDAITEMDGIRRRRSTSRDSVLRRAGSHVFLPRMVTRDLPFHQSKNMINVRNDDKDWFLLRIRLMDWFHSLLRLPPQISVAFLLCLWVACIAAFAGLYTLVDHIHYHADCGLGEPGSPISFSGAFAFSLETCTTVGYSLPGTTNAFFEYGCSGLQTTIFLQMMWSMLFNAFLFAFFYSLLSKSEFRSTQIVFTDKLLINCSAGKVYARLQCYDIDSAYPLVEAHARMYVLDHKLKMHPLRLCDPNDDLGGMLYPSVPADIVHHIDHHSVLSPRKMPFVESCSGLVLRSLDSLTNNREEIVCPVCAESYGSYERLKTHVEYNAMVEAKEKYPKDKSHVGLILPVIEPLTVEEVRSHIERTLSEIVVVVEAIDPQLSGTFQSLQSYKYEDIVFGAEFAKCMFVRNKKFTVDTKKFHTVEYRDNSDYVQSLLDPRESKLSPVSENVSDVEKAEMGAVDGDQYFGRSYRTFQSDGPVFDNGNSDYLSGVV